MGGHGNGPLSPGMFTPRHHGIVARCLGASSRATTAGSPMSPGGASPRRRGDRFERLVKADLERQGWLVVRAPGSGSGSDGTPVEGTSLDLIAVRRNHPPMLVSCKLGGKIARAERDTLAQVAERFGCVAVVVSKPSRGLIGWRMVHPPESGTDADAQT